MTCGVCGYEFCWACGESASRADGHFRPGRGCGAAQMDENIQANSRKVKHVFRCCPNFCLVLLCILTLPLILLASGPYLLLTWGLPRIEERINRRTDNNCCQVTVLVLSGILLFLLGLVANIVTIPAVILGGIFVFIRGIYRCCRYIGCNFRCVCNEGERANRERAERRFRERERER